MSYDIRFGVNVAGTDKDVIAIIGQPEKDSPTYNLREMFVKCMDWDYKQGNWYKITDVLPKIERGIHELIFNSSAYKQYEPENGWGNISSAISVLKSIISWFYDEWESRWDTDIPLECIYMKW